MHSEERMSEEVATCAAAIVMDGIFREKTPSDAWARLSAGQAQRTVGDSAAIDRRTLFLQLYLELAGGDADPLDLDPNGEIYSTPFQTNANAYFAGNMTFVFKPTHAGGSGIDTIFATARMCPGPMLDDASRSRWCQTRDEGVVEVSAASTGNVEL